MGVDISDLLSETMDWVDAGAEAAATGWGDELDVPVKTGALKASQEVETGGGGWVWSGGLAFTEDYASYTDTGAGAHRIDGNPLLAFDWNGQHVVVHSVNHPGTAGTDWFTDAVTDDTWAQRVEDNLGDLG